MNTPVETPKGTCQICGKSHKLPKGRLALHGYKRPGEGWQTSSCDGAKYLPIEISNVRLAEHIEGVKVNISVLQARLDEAITDIHLAHTPQTRDIRPTQWFVVNESNFKGIQSANAIVFNRHRWRHWDEVKERELNKRKFNLRQEKEYLEYQTLRLEASNNVLPLTGCRA